MNQQKPLQPNRHRYRRLTPSIETRDPRTGLMVNETQTLVNQMTQHILQWGSCTKCKLGCDPELRERTFFKGTLPCEVLFIGEAPGFSENTSGLPFDNPQAAGWVFDAIIDLLLASNPEFTWACTNSVICLPIDDKDRSKTREPNKEEIGSCQERLIDLVFIAKPKLIVAMGGVAEKATRGIETYFSGNKAYSSPIFHIRYIFTKHPSWMQRDGQDTNLEIKRAVLNIQSIYRQLTKEQSVASNAPTAQPVPVQPQPTPVQPWHPYPNTNTNADSISDPSARPPNTLPVPAVSDPATTDPTAYPY